MSHIPPLPASQARLRRLLGYLAADPGNARLCAEVFDLALATGAFDEASRRAGEALARAPRDPAWRARLALLHMARAEWDAARTLLEELHDEGATDAALAYNLAYVDFAQGRIERAEARLEPLVANCLAELPDSLALLVSCRHRRGAADEALAAFTPHAEAGANAAAFGAASLAALDLGQADPARAWAEQALERDAVQQEALVTRATLLVGERDAAGALALLAQAAARAPRDGRVMSTAALAEMLAGRMPRARALYEQAVVAMPGHIGTWLGLAWCTIFMEDIAAARRAAEAALALDPAFGESHGAMAVVEALEGRADLAEASIRRARGLDRHGLGAEYACAILEGESRDRQRLLYRAERALARHVGPDGRSLAEIVLEPRRR